MRNDLYFLLRYGLGRSDVEHPWILARCKEVQAAPNGYLDLWSREHYKSTIITFALTIQDILRSHGGGDLEAQRPVEREATVGIFSFNSTGATKFLSFILQELTDNPLLKWLFDDILYEKPEAESERWSAKGLIVKRSKRYRECTVEAYGLVDSMPTGSHFFLRVYDDIITERFARSPDMVQKATESWELSINLGARGGWERYIGTRYGYNDPYRTIIDRKAATPRIYPATENGEFDGEPVMITKEELAAKVNAMGPYTAGAQLMQNPLADKQQGFKQEWLKYHDIDIQAGWQAAKRMNRYILVDPADQKKKHSDRTAIVVMGLGDDQNYYLLDAVWDRLNLEERTRMLFMLHKKWRPQRRNGVGYEKYGKDSDIQHIRYVQGQENYRFDVTALGGRLGNFDRVRRLHPVFFEGRFFLPNTLWRMDYEGRQVDLVKRFVEEEYLAFPIAHPDLFDAVSRIVDEDLGAQWPKFLPDDDKYIASQEKRLPVRRSGRRGHSTWLGA